MIALWAFVCVKLTTFGTATDITLAELSVEAFLPGDHATATALRQAAERGAWRARPG